MKVDLDTPVGLVVRELASEARGLSSNLTGVQLFCADFEMFSACLVFKLAAF